MDNKMIFAALKGLGEGVLEGMKIKREQNIETKKMELEQEKLNLEKTKVASQSKYYSEVLPLIKAQELGVKQKQANTSALNVTMDQAAALAGTKQGYSKTLAETEETIGNLNKRIAAIKAQGGDVAPLLKSKRSAITTKLATKSQMDDLDAMMIGKVPKKESALYQSLLIDLETLDPDDIEGERSLVNEAEKMLDPAEAVKFRKLFKSKKGF